MSIAVCRYSPEYEAAWNDLVANSRNGTFLLDRSYMDYHADRFKDESLLFFDDKNGHIKAIFPANRSDDKLVSHSGLTYGGLVYPAKGISAPQVLDIFNCILRYCRSNGINQLIYKAIPHIYHRQPAEDDIYALFRCGAVLSRVNLSAAVDMATPIGMDSSYRRYVRLANKNDILISESNDLASFWNILTARLRQRYDVRPVHTLTEMTMLKDRFPDNIRLFTASRCGSLLGGSLIYYTDTCAHSQYIATTDDGRAIHILPALFDYIMTKALHGCRWLDFGTSNEQNGHYLNEGLIEQKYCMGARGIVYPTYTIDI